ncbi:hypothetical protein V1477_014487 [Vespula maculifrons]|uniref:Uncharacterized protein n=1 Tax=Vespula maculifrons TaxID=7453 RepID=A0ABD2BHK8_VESMC
MSRDQRYQSRAVDCIQQVKTKMAHNLTSQKLLKENLFSRVLCFVRCNIIKPILAKRTSRNCRDNSELDSLTLINPLTAMDAYMRPVKAFGIWTHMRYAIQGCASEKGY